jgi:hypothetical protein
MIDAAEIAKQLILAEQERRAIAPFTHLNPELDIDTRTPLSASSSRLDWITGSASWSQTGPDEPSQAEGHGRRLATVRAGDRPHDCTLRRADSVGRVDSSASRARDRVRAGP